MKKKNHTIHTASPARGNQTSPALPAELLAAESRLTQLGAAMHHTAKEQFTHLVKVCAELANMKTLFNATAKQLRPCPTWNDYAVQLGPRCNLAFRTRRQANVYIWVHQQLSDERRNAIAAQIQDGSLNEVHRLLKPKEPNARPDVANTVRPERGSISACIQRVRKAAEEAEKNVPEEFRHRLHSALDALQAILAEACAAAALHPPTGTVSCKVDPVPSTGTNAEPVVEPAAVKAEATINRQQGSNPGSTDLILVGAPTAPTTVAELVAFLGGATKMGAACSVGPTRVDYWNKVNRLPTGVRPTIAQALVQNGAGQVDLSAIPVTQAGGRPVKEKKAA